MARPPEFDRTKTLEAAMKLFWSRGYTATSLADLLDAMNIGRSSFYASFGTKRTLFMECLELFGSRTCNRVTKDAVTLHPRALARVFFEATILNVSKRRANHGCMLVNTILELADVDQELSQLATDWLDKIEATFAKAFSDALHKGELGVVTSPTELASQVMTINFGLRVRCRQRQNQKEMIPIVESSLSVLGLAA